MSRRRAKSVGVYGGDLLPGTYLRTHTGVQRGEELFCRPDLHRPWRSVSAQKSASRLAKKEQEIEQLLRLCSQLRSELGNARSDARSVEFAVVEQAKTQLRAKDTAIAELRERVDALVTERDAANDHAAQQIRLLQAQHEQSMLQLKTDARVAAEQLAALTQSHQSHVRDIREAYARELTLLESRHRARVDELTAELAAARSRAATAESHHAQQAAEAAGMVARLEADFADRLRAREQRAADAQRASEEQLRGERAATAHALAEARRATEQASTARAERAELLQHDKQWNSYLATALDTCYDSLLHLAPDVAAAAATAAGGDDDGDGDDVLRGVPSDATSRLRHDATAVARRLCAPAWLADVDARVTAEHVLRRVGQLCKLAPAVARAAAATHATTAATTDASAPAGVPCGRGGGVVSDAQMAHLVRRQERLQRAVDETTDEAHATTATLHSCLARLYFFSDNLQQLVARAPARSVPPSPTSRGTVVLACLLVAHARALWASDAGVMRSAMTLLLGVVRVKMGEYGAYECYSDDGSVLLAFDDAVAACRFCGDCQEWLLHVPWPRALLQYAWCREEHDGSADAGVLLFRGLRVTMAVHAGPVMREATALVRRGGAFHMHYYGATVAHVVHLAAATQGGQILVTRPAWTLCAHRREELRALLVREAGSRRVPVHTAGAATALAGGVQELEVLQLCPAALQGRTFATASPGAPDAASAAAMAPAALCTAMSADVVTALEQRRDALNEAVVLLRSEAAVLHDAVDALLARARHARVHFRALSPVAMAEQMNDLYRVLERVAVDAETTRADVQTVAQTQLELDAQLRGVRAYMAQCSATCEQADVLRAELERNALQAEDVVQRMRAAHAQEVHALQRKLHYRDHAERMHASQQMH